MTTFPLWVAQNKHKIIIYDSQLKCIDVFTYTPTNELQIKYLVHLCNSHNDLSILYAIR
ncbi:hypothetical protein [Crassaminicella thermophila]|uniref:hypothetical protein n=1 Tax=Crassaminicella thermophila TaxID=2599308 RepID=UPI00143D23C3|nr:hypothetical protein [Crassaminicella thermophila]